MDVNACTIKEHLSKHCRHRMATQGQKNHKNVTVRGAADGAVLDRKFATAHTLMDVGHFTCIC